jgi:hypothetical protein
MLREIIQFFAQMPSDTMMIFIIAVLGLAGTLIVLKWVACLYGPAGWCENTPYTPAAGGG